MQNLEGKKTTLGDDAEIYKIGDQRSEGKSAKEHWNELSGRAKWEYFRNYYLLKTILAVVILVLVGAVVYAAVRPKPKELAFIVILDNVLDPIELEEYMEKKLPEMGEEKGKATVTFNTRLSSSQQVLSDIQAISTYIYAGTLDIMIAREDGLKPYAKVGMLCDLSETLPADILNAIPEESRFIYHFDTDREVPEQYQGKDMFVGFRIDDTEIVTKAKNEGAVTDYVLSLVASGDGLKNGDTFKVLRVILGLPNPAE